VYIFCDCTVAIDIVIMGSVTARLQLLKRLTHLEDLLSEMTVNIVLVWIPAHQEFHSMILQMAWPEILHIPFLANVNLRSRSLYAIARPSVVCRLSSVCLSSVCNVRAPYSGGLNFRQYFCGIRYLGHPLESTKNFTEIVQGEPLRLWS